MPLTRRRSTVVALILGLTAIMVLATVMERRVRLRQERQEAAHRREMDLESGRRQLLRGDAARAVAFLASAYDGAEDDIALRFLVARAMGGLDGRQVDLSAEDGQIRIGAWASSRTISVLPSESEGPLRSADLNPSWSLMAIVDADGRGWLIDPFGDPTSDPRAAQPKRLGSKLLTLVFSPEGSVGGESVGGETLAGVGENGGLQLWRADDGVLLAEAEGAGPVLAFSPDGTRLATASDSGEVRIWNARNGASVAEYVLAGSFGRGFVQSLAFAADGRRLISGGDGGAMIWEASSGRPLVSLDSPVGVAVKPLVLAPTSLASTSLASTSLGRDAVTLTAGGSPELRFWSLADGELIGLLEGHRAAVCCLAFSSDGGLLLSVSGAAEARIWDARRQRLLAALPLPKGKMIHAEYGPGAERIAVVTAAGELHVVSLPLDSHGAAELDRSRRCHVPWRLADGRLLPRVPDARACREITPGARLDDLPAGADWRRPHAAAERPPQDVGKTIRAQPAEAGRWHGESLSVRWHQSDLVEALRSLARLADLDLMIAPGVRGTVTADLEDMPWDQVLAALLEAYDLQRVDRFGLVQILPREVWTAEAGPMEDRTALLRLLWATKNTSPGQPVSMSLRDADLREVLRSFDRVAGVELSVDGDVAGRFSCEIKKVPWDRIFAALAGLHDLRFEVARIESTGRQVVRVRRGSAPPGGLVEDRP